MNAFRKYRARLADDTGSALIDSMAGVLVASIAVLGLATIATNVSNAVSNTAGDAALLSTIRSHVHDVASHPDLTASVTSPEQSTVTSGDTEAIVTTWSTSTSGSTVIHAAVPRWSQDDPALCADPASIDLSLCLTTSVTVTPGGSGISTSPVAAVLTDDGFATSEGAESAPTVIGVFNPAAASTEVRFVVRVSSAASGSLIFTDSAGSALETIPFAAADEYLYGTVNVAPGSTVTASLSGAPAHVSHLYVYEAPR